MGTSKGAGLEGCLSDYHALLQRQGKALVTHIPTPVQIRARATGGAKERWGGIMQSAGNMLGADPASLVIGQLRPAQWPDYVGVLRGGRCVAIEAKECSGESFPWRTRVRTHQAEYLAHVNEWGGVAAVFVRRIVPGVGEADYFIPWGSLQYCAFVAKWRDLEPWRIPAHRWGWYEMTLKWEVYCGRTAADEE